MQTSAQSPAQPRTAYDLVGGQRVIQDFVDRFYDLMEADPAYAELRALHAPDLVPMRASLAGFLSAWLGGPRDWFDERPGVCMMSAHRGVAMGQASARQWAEAMTRALTERVPDKALGHQLAEALTSMALGMAGVDAA